jgi:Tfp pilus assembly protein PilF
LFRYLLFLSTLFVLFGCSSSPNNLQNTNLDRLDNTQVTLSHVKAYLLISNTVKAEERFQTIITPELVPGAMLALAQLRAAKGDNLGAQQAFMFALDNQSPPDLRISPKLLDYFCHQKKWQALESYGTGLLDPSNVITTNNASLSKIGQCFFRAQEWSKAKYWLNQLDLTQTVAPLDFLALARLDVDDKRYPEAEQFIIRFEKTKNKIDAHTLWTALEVYQGLQKPERAEKIGHNLSVLFPSSDYTLVYQQMLKLNPKGLSKTKKVETPQQANLDNDYLTHTIIKGETLYQLTKKYKKTLAQLMLWNPNLVINDIPLGTKIKLGSEQN